MSRAPLGKNSRTREGDARRREVLDIVTSDAWVPGRTVDELARKWGVGENTVYHYHTDALRIVRASLGGDTCEGLATEIMARCDRLYRLAVGQERPDIAGAVSALRLQAQVAGVMIRKTEHTIIDERTRELAALTDEQLAARARDLIGRVGVVH